jgi:hypothetical protein
VNDNGLTFEVHLYVISPWSHAYLSGLFCVLHSSRASAVSGISEMVNKSECHASKMMDSFIIAKNVDMEIACALFFPRSYSVSIETSSLIK